MEEKNTVDGLDTVKIEERRTDIPFQNWLPSYLPPDKPFSPTWSDDPSWSDRSVKSYERRALVTRSQAEAIISALTARVKELETVETQWQRDGENSWHNEKYEFRPSGKTKTRKLVNRSDAEALINYERKQATAAHDADAKAFLSAYNRATALETQLAAARKALEEIAGDTYDDSAEKIARAALEVEL